MTDKSDVERRLNELQEKVDKLESLVNNEKWCVCCHKKYTGGEDDNKYCIGSKLNKYKCNKCICNKCLDREEEYECNDENDIVGFYCEDCDKNREEDMDYLSYKSSYGKTFKYGFLFESKTFKYGVLISKKMQSCNIL